MGETDTERRTERVSGFANSLQAVVPRDRYVRAAWLELHFSVVEGQGGEVLHDDVRKDGASNTCNAHVNVSVHAAKPTCQKDCRRRRYRTTVDRRPCLARNVYLRVRSYT